MALHRRPGEPERRSLAGAIGRPELCDDPRFDDAAARAIHGAALATEIGSALQAKPAQDWFAVLDVAGVPCEVVLDSPLDVRSSGGSAPTWFEDPDAVANGWVLGYDHPVWGRLDQPGGLVELSGTESTRPGPPPIVGAHTAEVLAELGFASTEIKRLRAEGIVAW